MSESNKTTTAAASLIKGTSNDDTIADGYKSETGATLSVDSVIQDQINGGKGNDQIDAGAGDDLAAGDTLGSEWTMVDGKWVYDASKVDLSNIDPNKSYDESYDDLIKGGSGDDIVLGNWGKDTLFGGTGADRLNGGSGDDRVFGGDGNDILNLESGNDYAEGGRGDDIINGGAGNDVIYGDFSGANILSSGTESGATSFEQFAATGAWEMTQGDGDTMISQAVETNDGQSYTISFDLAANLSSGAACGKVEVLWNGEVVGAVETTSGVYETHEIDIVGTGEEGKLTFREVMTEAEPEFEINSDGPILSYDKSVSIGGEDYDVQAFVPGQSKLYQVINGDLKVFDTAAKEYTDAGVSPGFKINAIGFNVDDDLIYGIAKGKGVDAAGNTLDAPDLVMIDATGAAYRIGDTSVSDYVGDFDADGNLWTFQSGLNRVTKIDVDNLDANGNPVEVHYDLPDNFFQGRTFDIAYNAEENAFMAVESPGANRGAGTVHKFDLSGLANGGEPSMTSLPITGTLYGDDMTAGMAKGAYGAVFFDGDGNLYYGLNRGDHDLDASTGATGGIFKVNVDWENGAAYSEFMAESQATGSNDGAVDPRAADPFAQVDADAPFLLRNPELTTNDGGNDDLRGGTGDDLMFGGIGGDSLYGGDGDDTMSGDEGADKLRGGDGNDSMSGGEGNDQMGGGEGDDILSGGAGKDYINADSGDDEIFGGDGADKIVGGKGSDTIEGGAGDDHMWGGKWWKDGFADTFVVSSGSGKDMIHDFESDKDVIDLSSYGVEFDDVQNLLKDKGWATELDLSGLSGGTAGDKLIIKSVDPDDLDESNFIL